MCGILGCIDRGAASDRADFAAALDLLRHRGPDADGIYEKPPALLGHRRLSIIDLDARANQPFRLGPLTITYNGEIYNFKEVRRDLQQAGYSFRTESDTEVIIAAFRHEGLACLDSFEGMFAFAVWDEDCGKLTLVRDRFGEKPLYYYHDRDRFLFASEIAPLEALVGRDRLELDQDALGLYFQFSYIPAPFAPYRNMRQLEPAAWLELDAADWSVRRGRYYALRPQDRAFSAKEAETELRDRLDRSIRLRLSASDVPVATFLSGGVDSSIISVLAAAATPQRIHAYSIAFPEDPEFDESPFARLVADNCPGIDHTVIDVTESRLKDFTEKVLGSIAEPYADASLIPTAYLCSHVEEKVVLGGDGADEIFAGYGVYEAMQTSARIPLWVKRIARALPSPRNPHAIKTPRLRAAALFRDHLGLTALDEYLSWRCYVSQRHLEQLGFGGGGDARRAIGDHDLGTLKGLLALDIRFNLPNDMLKKVDRASMQYGLEVRLPYLDRGLVEFALGLPDDLLIGHGERKHILRSAFRNHLPDPIFTRIKQGFLLPIRRWFKAGRIREELLDLAETDSTLDCKSIQRFAQQHSAGRYDHSMLLWTVFVFLSWNARSLGR